MFSGLIERLRREIKAIKDVVELHEFSRDLFYFSEPEAGQRSDKVDLWQVVRTRDPGKTAWQVYDHCAALLRLYAVYSIFLEDLVADYLNALPELYETYDQLPEAVLRQHRTGFGQIMLKLGESGPYRHLKESEIILQLSQGVSGAGPYKLLKDAFFVDRQNYRSEMLARLFGNLGLENVCSRVAKHPSMKAFLAERYGNTTTFESELDGFVKLRNDAAHSPVEQIIATSQFLTIADFVLLVCEVLTEFVSRERMLCMAERRRGTELGVVVHVYHAGKVAIVKMMPSTIAVGDDIAVVARGSIRIAKILSIQKNDVPATSLTALEGEEVGVGLDQRCQVGELLRMVGIVRVATDAQLPLSSGEELAGTGGPSDTSDELESSEGSPGPEMGGGAEIESGQ